MTRTVPLPQEGGSYVLGKSGRLERQATTLGPLHPEHAANKTAPPDSAAAAPAGKET